MIAERRNCVKKSRNIRLTIAYLGLNNITNIQKTVCHLKFTRTTHKLEGKPQQAFSKNKQKNPKPTNTPKNQNTHQT